MIGLIVGVAFALVGTVAVIRSLWDLGDAVASRKWAIADGTVLVSDLQRSGGSDGVTYRAEIAYRYVVNGQELIGSRARFGDWVSVGWSRPAISLTRKYRVGSSVLVRYNPEEPSEAVLEPGVRWNIGSCLIFGILFLGIGVLALVRA